MEGEDNNIADQNNPHREGEAPLSGQQQQQELSPEAHVTPTKPPPPPNPSTDPRLRSQARTPSSLGAANPDSFSQDLFTLPPIAALKLLSSGIDALVRITGDVPPTPPPANPTFPHMRGMQREKADLARTLSEKSLTRLREQAEKSDKQKAQEAEGQGGFFGNFQPPVSGLSTPSSGGAQQPIDGVRLRHTSPPPAAAPPGPYVVIGADSQPLNLQHSAITRKFFSKVPPPISIEDYLLRIHQYCPMSTAVYLATSFYIFRLAVEERAIPVTNRNCHRLLLAGLRVAMKALEDLNYPQKKMARVGGVSEVELARLEISFCFLAGFELRVDEEALRTHWETLKSGKPFLEGRVGAHMPQLDGVPVLKLENRRKKKEVAEAVGT